MHFDCDLAPFASFRIETLTLPCPWKCVPLLNSFKQIQTRGVFVILWTSYQSASVSSKIFFLIKHNSKKYLPKVVFVFCKIFGSLQKHNLYGQLVSSVHGIIHHWRPVVNFSVWMATVVQPSGLCSYNCPLQCTYLSSHGKCDPTTELQTKQNKSFDVHVM